jgi:hypothetical protein
MFLEEDKHYPMQKNPNVIKPCICIISFVLELVLYIITHMVVATKITTYNNQYFQDWSKTHWVTISVKKFDTFYAIAHVWGNGILFCKAMVCHE